MEQKILVVVDMQNDFITGSLGSEEAKGVVSAVAQKIYQRKAENYTVLFTMDTHDENYLSTAEGNQLPIVHCVKNTYGWQLCGEILPLSQGCKIYEKDWFGSRELISDLTATQPDIIEFIGLCTDICVFANAVAAKTSLHEKRVIVDGACCAGSTPEMHDNALKLMRGIGIEII